MSDGNLQSVIKLNTVNYQDMDGQTALHKATAAGQTDIVTAICKYRPILKGISDNVSEPSLQFIVVRLVDTSCR